MKPVNFDEQNVVFGANQPEYIPLPTLLATDGSATTCWELEPGELEEIQKTGKIWFNQLTFFQPLQPIRPHVFKPELGEPVKVAERQITGGTVSDESPENPEVIEAPEKPVIKFKPKRK